MRIYLNKLINATVLAAMILLPFDSLGRSAQSTQETGTLETANGLSTVTFAMPEGKIRVYLPDDIRAGDTISGTVSAEPAGSSESQRSANLGVLEGTVVDIGGEKASPGKRFKIDLKRLASTGEKALSVGLAAGQTARKVRMVLSTPASSAPMPSFRLPSLTQAGRPFPIIGPFDGDFSNTNCTMGGNSLALLAESPRKASFRGIAGISGPTNIEVNERGTITTGVVRNVGVELTSPKTDLLKGEKTTLTVRVSGLQGITENVPLQLVTAGSANMAGGNLQNLEIKPENVSRDGTYSQNFSLTGTTAGGFNVVGTVITGDPVAGDGKCKCNCEFAKPAITGDTSRSKDGGGVENTFKANMKRADCTGSKCSVRGTSYSWSVGAASTAAYKVREGTDKAEKLIVDTTKEGTLVITVTVTVTCSDGSKCTATATETLKVKG